MTPRQIGAGSVLLIQVTQQPWRRLTLMKVTATDANTERGERPRLLEEDVTHRILKCFYRVYDGLGFGFLESVYQQALFWEL
jgi:hypothetical protein